MKAAEAINIIDEIKRDDFTLSNYSIFSIMERIENALGKGMIEWETEVLEETYGSKRIARAIVKTDPVFSFEIEQTGSNGVYATYFSKINF